jgi:hypothetical protein
MDDLQIYNDGIESSEEMTTSSDVYFRRKSMALITYPWLTAFSMVESKLADCIVAPDKDGEQRFIFVSYKGFFFFCFQFLLRFISFYYIY